MPHSTRDAGRYSSFVNKYIGDLSLNESRSSLDWRFWGLILWNSLWFAKPTDRVELAPSFFEAIQEQLGLKLCQPRLQRIVLDYGQFFGRTFWGVRKLTLNLTKRRAHTPSIKTAVMDLLTEQARSACRDADRSTHPPH